MFKLMKIILRLIFDSVILGLSIFVLILYLINPTEIKAYQWGITSILIIIFWVRFKESLKNYKNED